MSSRLLEHALTKEPKFVLDIGAGNGYASKAFIGHGAKVVGVDVNPAPHEHEQYSHIESAFELLDPADDFEPYDLIWFSNVLQSMPNVQAALVQVANLLADDGWLYIAVPCGSQDRLHIGSLTTWTPALLIYNLICAGYDCSEALWFTEYETIGLCVQKRRIEDMSWRTGSYDEPVSQYAPLSVRHEGGAWWANNWPDETGARASDPPLVTSGVIKSNLPPQVQLAFGPNPKLRKPHGTYTP